MASIKSAIQNINASGISIEIVMDNGIKGDHVLTIKSNQENRYAWTYTMTDPQGNHWRLRSDYFLHDGLNEFDQEDIFHVSAMAQTVMATGHQWDKGGSLIQDGFAIRREMMQGSKAANNEVGEIIDQRSA